MKDIARSLHRQEQVNIIIIGFEKVFDTVVHRRLMAKLEHYGVTGIMHQWIAHWLIGRTQCVTIEGERYKDETVGLGVPQGAVLGP